jgi:hypothetical protein
MRNDISLEDINKNICTEACKIAINIEEYEIAVLELINKKHEKNYLFRKINEKNKHIDVNSPHKIIFKTFEGLLETSLIVNEIDIDNMYIENKAVKSVICPRMPILVVESNFLPSDLHGLSGSSIVDEFDNTIALISYSIGNIGKLNCVPLSIIIKFITESKRQKISSFTLSSIFNTSDIIGSVYMGKEVTFHRVSSGHDILYSSNGKKKLKFLEGDIIKRVNHIDFNSNGTIYHEELDLNVELPFYILIETLSNKHIKFDMFRLDNKEYKEHSIIILGMPIEHVYDIYPCNKNNYIIWKNYVFTELSEELSNELLSEGIGYPNIYNNLIPSASNIKQTIIFDGKTIKIADKIGNKKINSLIDIKTLLNSNSKLTLSCKTFNGEIAKIFL